MDLKCKYVIATNLKECDLIINKAKESSFEFSDSAYIHIKKAVKRGKVYFMFEFYKILTWSTSKIFTMDYQEISLEELTKS